MVSIDCYSVWFDFVFGCVDKFDPVADCADEVIELNVAISSRPAVEVGQPTASVWLTCAEHPLSASCH